MSSLVEDVLHWSQCNLRNINWCKTKDLILGSNSAKNFCRELCVDGNVVKRVSVYKLLGVTVDDTLKWKSHVNFTCAEASKRLHFLKILKRSSFSIGDLLCFYTSAVRPVLEYACPMWHNSLTNEQCQQIESIQRCALKIICGQNYTGYYEICSNLELFSLVDRRSELCKAFFEKSVLDGNSCLHYLLPP